MTLPLSESQTRSNSWQLHVRETMTLGLPMIGAQLAQMLINTTDIIMLGWLGTVELAAGVLATQAFFIVFIFGTGLALAAMPLAAQAAGKGDHAGVRRATRMGCWVSILYGGVVMLPLWYLEPALLWLGQDEEVAAFAGDYIVVALFAMIPALLGAALRSFYSAVQRAQLLLVATIAGTLINVVLNYAFIFGNLGAPALGIAGAAVASLGTSCLIFLILFCFPMVASGFEKYELYVRIWRPDWPVFFDILRLGWPIGVAIVAEVGLFIAASVFMGWIGTVQLAAHGIALQLASLTFMVPLGLSNVATVRVGHAFGKVNLDQARRASTVVFLLSALFGLAAAFVFWAFPEPLINLFLDQSNADADAVALYGVSLLLIAAAFQLFDGLQAIATGVLRGLSDTKIPMILAVASYWGMGLSTAYILGFVLDFGGLGIWVGLAVGLAAATLLLGLRYLLIVERVFAIQAENR